MRGCIGAPNEERSRDERDVVVLSLRVGDTELAVVSAPVANPSALARLTKAEREVLIQVLAGASNAEIAAARRTSARTVGNQVAALFQKLGVTSRGALAALLPQ
jgi:DNA-binding CsgD family transcriptional regulator